MTNHFEALAAEILSTAGGPMLIEYAAYLQAENTLLRELLDMRAREAETYHQLSDSLRARWSKADDDICQTLGQALGYPWYIDDPDNFPDATIEHGVCVTPHVAETIVMEAAVKIHDLQLELQKLKESADA